MKNYIFKTKATMKDYNRKKWWIDEDIIKNINIQAKDIESAIEIYRKTVDENAYITISNNAIRNKRPMYIDGLDGQAKQVGYVITASTKMDDGHWNYIKQYIDLWIEILTVVDTQF